MSSICRDYDQYRCLTIIRKLTSGVDLEALFVQELLSAQARNSVKVLEKCLSATRTLIIDMSCAMQVPKKGYVDLIKTALRGGEGGLSKVGD